MSEPIIIDCDPGVDDAVALLLAFASPELEILAVTTVGGNVAAAKTARNACIIREIAGREAVPVFAGAARPLVREPVEAGDFHGAEGLGFRPASTPAQGIAPGMASRAIVDIVMARPARSVSLVVIGPMTNVAAAMASEPALAARLKQVIVMGGARSEGGNITASAEFNIFADPHAAAAVFASGAPIVCFGLDATHQVRATEARIAAIEALATPAAEMAAAMLRFSRRVEREVVRGLDAPLHDPCPIAWLLRPDLFDLKPCRIDVETASPLTMGHTAVEFRSEDPNARWAVSADADGVFALITERLA
ncbi:MAG: nucleoside hydrolase [Sphingomonadaceae bacterium]|nr:nucleoside hydrolase [Sphingomonadaceae bacterium]